MAKNTNSAVVFPVEQTPAPKYRPNYVPVGGFNKQRLKKGNANG